MSIARGWGHEGQKHRWEDYLKESTDDLIRNVLRPQNRRDKIKKILDVNKHSR